MFLDMNISIMVINSEDVCSYELMEFDELKNGRENYK